MIRLVPQEEIAILETHADYSKPTSIRLFLDRESEWTEIQSGTVSNSSGEITTGASGRTDFWPTLPRGGTETARSMA
jgi:hypothetical protein